MKKPKLKDLLWLDYFRQSGQGHILRKTALRNGNKIGVFNPFGQIIYVDENIEVVKIEADL
jgi:hypothetical protein